MPVADKKRIEDIQRMVIEIYSILDSMQEVGRWRTDGLRQLIQKMKDERGWL